MAKVSALDGETVVCETETDKKDADNGIMAISFYSYSLPDFAYHNGKQISSISGRFSYFKFKTIRSTILNDDLADNLNPFYLAPMLYYIYIFFNICWRNK